LAAKITRKNTNGGKPDELFTDEGWAGGWRGREGTEMAWHRRAQKGNPEKEMSSNGKT